MLYRKLVVFASTLAVVLSSHIAIFDSPQGAWAESPSDSSELSSNPGPADEEEEDAETEIFSVPVRDESPDSKRIVHSPGDDGLSGEAQTRIVGGSERTIDYAPWQVAIIDLRAESDYAGQFCGGSVISPEWIVSAAHCFDSSNPANIGVLAGSASLSTDSLSAQGVSRIILHPSYSDRTSANDIALLRLSTPLTLESDVIEAIGLPTRKPASGTAARVTGWGSTWCSNGFESFNDEDIAGCGAIDNLFPSELHGASILVQSDRTCSSELGRSYSSRSMLCASTPGYLQDTCQGDSGGPMAVQVGGNWVLAGITSWGFGCAWSSSGVYTNVTNYTRWITANAPLPGVSPETSIPDGTATGFTFQVTNYDSSAKYGARVVSGAGKVRVGKGSGGTVPVTVTGVSPGSSATIRVTVVKNGYSTTFTDVSGAADDFPTPELRLASDSGTSFRLEVVNYDRSYRYGAVIVSGSGAAKVGRASGSILPISVTRVGPGSEVTVRVTITMGRNSESVTFVRSP